MIGPEIEVQIELPAANRLRHFSFTVREGDSKLNQLKVIYVLFDKVILLVAGVSCRRLLIDSARELSVH